MTTIQNSSGEDVQITVTGVDTVLAKIRQLGQDIVNGKDTGALQAANFLQQEVQASIMGERSEEKSVDTGTLANSITTDRISEGVYSVNPGNVPYPNSNTTTNDTALFMEYGTSRISPRMHFRNTVFRNQAQAKQIILNSIKKE